MVVYVDILLILNLFVDYFLLLGCCVLMKIDVKKRRLIFGAVVGSLFSLLIFVVDFNFLLFLFFKVFSGLVLVFFTFGFPSKKVFVKAFLVFLLENFIFVGVMFCVWFAFSPPGMLWKNGVTYIEISPIVLIVGSMVAYCLTCLFNSVFCKLVGSTKLKKIKIEFNNKIVELNALYDTGNCLLEPFSKKPVCVCEFDALSEILPENLAVFLKNFSEASNKLGEGFDLAYDYSVKLVPCNTINGESVLPAFLPQRVVVVCEKKLINYDCYVGVVNKKISDGEYRAIIGNFELWKKGAGFDVFKNKEEYIENSS